MNVKIGHKTFAIAYIVLIIIFGFVYYLCANLTNGSAFIFQNDLKIESKVRALKSKINSDIPDSVIKDVIQNYNPHDDYTLKLKMPNSSKEYVFRNKNIGEFWADFYQEKLRLENVTFFSFQETPNPDEAPISFSKEQIISADPKELIPYQSGRKYILKLYTGPPKTTPISPDQVSGETFPILGETVKGKTYKIVHVEEVWLTTPPLKIYLGKYGPRQFLPIDVLEGSLRYSLNYLDDTPLYIKDIVSRKYIYSFFDFLYFSAVTITTLGYGDILPNTTYIRLLVMVETLLGIIIIGSFLSTLWSSKK